MNKVIALAEQGKLARVRFKSKTINVVYLYSVPRQNAPVLRISSLSPPPSYSANKTGSPMAGCLMETEKPFLV